MSTEQSVKTEEQIPLTAAGGEAAPEASATETVVVEEPKPKKNWFTWGKKKTDASPEATAEEGGVVAEGEEKKEKKCWWKKCKGEKGEDAQKDDNIAIGIDLVHRDNNSINQHVQLAFDDIFGEADSQHSWDFAWRANYRVFTAVRLFVYRLVSLLALPFTILFAVFFGLLASLNVFLVVPFIKLLSIPGNLLAKLWNWIVHAVFDPLASALGLIFSKVSMRKYGINQETTAPCV